MKKTFALLIALMLAGTSFAQTKIIAHRGYHAKNSVQNSLSALRNAQDLKVYGSECDINETSDGWLVVAHGPNHGTYRIQDTDLKTLRQQMLANGEVLPVLDEYLDMVKRKPETKLIIEIKNHPTPERETEVVKKVLKAVKQHKLQDHVEYIAFRHHVCNELVAQGGKGIKVAYLNGDLTPEYCKGLGYTGIDYNINVLKKRPEWIHDSKRLGLTVNVWTVNKPEDLQWCVDNKVDFITTDNPEEAKQIAGQKK